MIFPGVFGGLLAFGVIGAFLGPTLLTVGSRLATEWTAVRPVPTTNVDGKAEFPDRGRPASRVSPFTLPKRGMLPR